MALQSDLIGNALVLNVRGRLDQDNCEAFRADLAPSLERAGREQLCLILNLAELDYVSSAGLRCLMLAAKTVKGHAGRIAVAALQPMVMEIFQISRFDLLLPVFPSVAAALAGLSTPGPPVPPSPPATAERR